MVEKESLGLKDIPLFLLAPFVLWAFLLLHIIFYLASKEYRENREGDFFLD